MQNDNLGYEIDSTPINIPAFTPLEVVEILTHTTRLIFDGIGVAKNRDEFAPRSMAIFSDMNSDSHPLIKSLFLLIKNTPTIEQVRTIATLVVALNVLEDLIEDKTFLEGGAKCIEKARKLSEFLTEDIEETTNE